MDPRLTKIMANATGGSDFVTGKKALGPREGLTENLPQIEDEDDDEEEDPTDTDDPEADPSEEGESTDEEDPSEEGEETDADASDEVVEDGETDNPPAEQDPPEEETEEPPPPPQEDPRDARIAQLEKRYEQLLQHTLSQQKPTPPPTPALDVDDLPDNVLNAVMFGTQEQINQVSAALTGEQRAKAQKLLERHRKAQIVLATKGPAAFYEAVREQVIQDVSALVQPLALAYEEQQVESMIRKHLGPIKDKEVRKRAVQIFAGTPGARSASWQDRDQALELSVKAAQGEEARRVAADKTQKNKAGKAQGQANGGKKLKGTNPKSSGAPPKKKSLAMRDNESLSQYEARLLKFESQ